MCCGYGGTQLLTPWLWQVLERLSVQLRVILEAQESTAKSQSVINQFVKTVAALKKQNDTLKQAQQLAYSALNKHEDASQHKLLKMEVCVVCYVCMPAPRSSGALRVRCALAPTGD